MATRRAWVIDEVVREYRGSFGQTSALESPYAVAGHFNALFVPTEVCALVDETPETMTAVQDRGQFHGGETSP